MLLQKDTTAQKVELQNLGAKLGTIEGSINRLAGNFRARMMRQMAFLGFRLEKAAVWSLLTVYVWWRRYRSPTSLELSLIFVALIPNVVHEKPTDFFPNPIVSPIGRYLENIILKGHKLYCVTHLFSNIHKKRTKSLKNFHDLAFCDS